MCSDILKFYPFKFTIFSQGIAKLVGIIHYLDNGKSSFTGRHLINQVFHLERRAPPCTDRSSPGTSGITAVTVKDTSKKAGGFIKRDWSGIFNTTRASLANTLIKAGN